MLKLEAQLLTRPLTLPQLALEHKYSALIDFFWKSLCAVVCFVSVARGMWIWLYYLQGVDLCIRTFYNFQLWKVMSGYTGTVASSTVLVKYVYVKRRGSEIPLLAEETLERHKCIILCLESCQKIITSLASEEEHHSVKLTISVNKRFSYKVAQVAEYVLSHFWGRVFCETSSKK